MNVKYDPLLGQVRENDNSSAIFYFKNALGVETYRLSIRSNSLCLDKILTETGFSGTEDIDWTMVNEF